jgi:hypothetical protein
MVFSFNIIDMLSSEIGFKLSIFFFVGTRGFQRGVSPPSVSRALMFVLLILTKLQEHLKIGLFFERRTKELAAVIYPLPPLKAYMLFSNSCYRTENYKLCFTSAI